MTDRILIIGSDLAGLTAGWRLLQQGFQVTLLSGPSQPVRPSHVGAGENQVLESGSPDMSLPCCREALPFLLYGPQDQTRSLLEDIGAPLSPHHLTPLRLAFSSPTGRLSRYRVYPFPTPWHTLLGMLTYSGLPLRARIALLNHLEALWEEGTSQPQGLDQQSADSWLGRVGQDPSTFPTVWNPLCRFLLGDELTATSAGNFTAVLTQWLFSTRDNAHISVSSQTEEAALIQPLREHLLRHGADIRGETHADSLLMTPDRVTGVRTQEGSTLTADWYVVALPPHTLAGLLPERMLAKSAYFYHLTQLQELPSVTCHLLLPGAVSPSHLILSNTTFHWMVFRVGINSKTTNVSCVATGQRALLEQSDHELLRLAKQDLRRLPMVPDAFLQHGPVKYHIVRQPNTGLSPAPGIAGLRPSQQSPISNLFLAGAWTDTGLPTGRESAIVSGNWCSEFLSVQAAASSTRFDNTHREP